MVLEFRKERNTLFPLKFTGCDKFTENCIRHLLPDKRNNFDGYCSKISASTYVKSHFMNSVFVQSGIYSCAVDCFLEVSRYLFLPELSKLTKRSEFPQLLFTAASNYRNQGGNSHVNLGGAHHINEGRRILYIHRM